MQLVLLGISYKTSSLKSREQLGCLDSRELLHTFYACPHILEVVILSTCNRFEIYAVTKDLLETRQSLLTTLVEQSGIECEQLEDSSYTYYNKFASEHLYKVSAGLDSMVLGENEILKQIKDGIQLAQYEQTSGTLLNRQFQSVIEAGKRVRTETAINKGSISIGSVASDLVSKYIDNENGRVLILGTGHIGEVTLNHLLQHPFNFFIANRTFKKAEHLAALSDRCDAIPFDKVSQVLPQVDAIIACTSSSEYLISPENLNGIKESIVLLDLSIPRNIDPSVVEIEGCHLYNMDDINAFVESSNHQRMQAVNHVESILADEKAKFLEWFNTLDVVPTIQSLYQSFDEIRNREIQRAVKKTGIPLDSEIEELLDRVTRAVTQKILHYPVVHLKMESDPEKKETALSLLSDIFKLNTQDYMDKYTHQSQVKKTAVSLHEKK